DLKADTGKMGLWPGGFFEIKAITTYGTYANNEAGGTVPVNILGLLPEPRQDTTTALMNLTFAQFLSPKFGIFAGKGYTLGGDDNPSAQTWTPKFLNTAMTLNIVLDFVPFSASGGGFIFIPWKGSIFTVPVIDPEGEVTQNDIPKAFENGVFVNAEG